MMQFDILFDDLGEMGLVQCIMFFFLCYSCLSSGFNSLATVFIAYEPDYRCNVSPLDNITAYPQLNESQILSLSTPYDSVSRTYSRCERYGFNLSSCQGDISCANSSYPTIQCDQGYHYDKSLFTETIVTEFDLICKNDYLNSLSTSLYYLGSLIGSLVFGNFADMVGRKSCCLVTFMGVLVFMLGVTYSQSIEAYIVCRMGVAIFVYGKGIGAYVYIMEIVGKKWRTTVGMVYQMFFSFGYMMFGGIAHQWRNWHEMMLIATIICSPFLLFVLALPESPRWLFSKNKEKEGIKAVKRMARINKVIISEETWNKARKAGEDLIKVNKRTERKYSTLDLFKSKYTMIITIKVAFSWFVNSLVYYGIGLSAGSLAGDLFVNNTLNGVFEIASYLFCILIMGRIGRRVLLSFLLLLAGGGLIASFVTNMHAGDDQVLLILGVVFAFVGKFGISGAWSVVYLLTTELYPTVIRSNGVALGSIAARLGGIFAPFLINLADHISWLPNAIFGILSIVAGLISLTFPETNGHVMMESIEEAERFYRGDESVLDDYPKAESLYEEKLCEADFRNKDFQTEQTKT